jgi:hypothetical protein
MEILLPKDIKNYSFVEYDLEPGNILRLPEDFVIHNPMASFSDTDETTTKGGYIRSFDKCRDNSRSFIKLQRIDKKFVVFNIRGAWAYDS